MGYSGYPPQGILGTAASIHSGAAFPPTPAEGDCFYRTDLNEFFIYDGAAWVRWEIEAHADEHEPGGADEVNDIDILGTGVNLSAHESRHVLGGADEIDSALNALAIALTTHGDIVYRAAAANTLARLAPGVAGQVLVTGGAGANPSWGAPPAVADTRGRTIVVAASNSIDVTLAPAAYRCDGVADQVEINAAIAALGAIGGTVILLEGTYILSGSITILLSNVTLRGNGYGSVLAGNPAGYFIEVGDNATTMTNVVIEKLRIDGTAQTAGGGIWEREGPGLGYRVHVRFCILHDIYGRGVYYDGAGPRMEACQIIGNHISSGEESLYMMDSDFAFITSNTFYVTGAHHALYIEDASGTVIEGNFINSQPTGLDAIILTDCIYCMVIGNYLFPHDDGVICTGTGYRNVIDGNVINGGSQRGVNVADTEWEIIVSNNLIYESTSGILVQGARCVIEGNLIVRSATVGIEIQSADNVIDGNFCYDNDTNGILLTGAGANNNAVTGNTVTGNSQAADNTHDGIMITTDSDHNNVQGNTVRHAGGAAQHRYGINIATDTCDGNIVIDNDLYLSGRTASFNDSGTGTKLETKIFQFQQGGEASGIVIAQFISADASAKGWEIDAADEWAIALGQLPLELQQVVRIKVWAVALVAEADKMRLEINANAGASDEPYTTKPIAVANKPSVTGNFAIDDVIYWEIDLSDDADIGDLAGGDSLAAKVKHAAAGNGDCETDAVLRCVEIEYV